MWFLKRIMCDHADICLIHFYKWHGLMPKLLLCDCWWRTFSKSFNEYWQNIEMNFSFFPHTNVIFNAIIIDISIQFICQLFSQTLKWKNNSHVSEKFTWDLLTLNAPTQDKEFYGPELIKSNILILHCYLLTSGSIK